MVDAVEPQIRALLGEWPTMPATVIAERIGWTRSLTVLKVRVRELRPVFLPPDPAQRTTYGPGELAQCDLWFPPVDVPLGAGELATPAQRRGGRNRSLTRTANPQGVKIQPPLTHGFDAVILRSAGPRVRPVGRC